VCGQPVVPWRRGWRRPWTTIHEACLTQVCRFCGATFTVRRACAGQFCCKEHGDSFRTFRMSAGEAEARGMFA